MYVIDFNGYEFQYQDSTFYDRGRFTFVHGHDCVVCRKRVGRGFMILNKNPIVRPMTYPGVRSERIGLVCLDCIYDFLLNHDFNVRSRQEIVFLDTELAKRYAIVYTHYKRERLGEGDYRTQREFFQRYMPDYVMEAVEYLADWDLEYGKNVHKGTQWRGWWLGITNQEVENALTWLKNGIKRRTIPSELFRIENRYERRVPHFITVADEVFKLYLLK